MDKPTKGLTAHKLAEIFLSMPDLPVRFQDYESMECQIVGLVSDTNRPLTLQRPTVLLEIEQI